MSVVRPASALLALLALPQVGWAQVAPPGAIIDLGTGTPPATSGYTQYSATVTPQTSGAYYALFAFREDPAYFRFDDASVAAVGSSTNLLTNPGFEDGSTTGTNGLPLPNGWGIAYQIGQPPPAAGRVNGYTPHSGSFVWYDGSVGSFDALYQVIPVTAGQPYLLSFFLNADDPFQTPEIEMATYFGSCGTAPGACTTAFGNGFVVSEPPRNATIDTAHGDIAPNVFSLGSPAAQAATVEFDGGTLRLQGGTFPDNVVPSPVLLTGLNGTVDTGPASGGFSGTVSGPGSLTVIGGNIFSLTGDNTFQGGTVLDGGTLRVGSSTALGTGDLTFGGGSLAAGAEGLSLGNRVALPGDGRVDTAGFGLTLAGAVSGAGRLVKAGAGTLTLSGDNSYAGGTLLQAGSLGIGSATALGTGPLLLDDGTTLTPVTDGLTVGNAIAFTGLADPTVDTGPNTLTLSGDITGGGALTKLGTGTLILTGQDSYAGATNVAAGTLLVNGAITVSPITIAGGAALGGTGSVASFTAASGAVVTPSSTGGLTVTGAATFQPGSTFEVTVNPDGSNTKLVVGGVATVGGSRLSVLAGPGTFSAARYTLLTAAGGVSGTFGTVSTAAALALLRPSVSYGANDVVLTLTPVDFATVAATPNQARTAAAIQALGPGNALYDAVLQQNQAGARRALDAASGVSHATATSTAQTNTRFTTGLVIDRLWDVSGNGLSAQQVLEGFAPDRLPALVRCYGPVPAPAPAPPQTFTAWGEGFGVFGHTDGTANTGSSDRSLGGFVLGVDTPLHGVLGDAWRGGVAVGYTNTQFTSTLDDGRGSVQGVYGSLYGGARYGAVDVRVGTTVGGTFVDARRTVQFPIFAETERSHNDGITLQSFGEVGYRIPVGPGVVEPVVGAAYLHTHQDGFRERGGAAALRVAALDTDLGITTLGVRGEVQPFGSLPLVAHVFLGWQHTFGDVSPTTTLAFEAAPGNTFSVTGVPIDRDALSAELALDYRATAALDLGLSYAGLIGSRAADHAVKGRIEYRF